MNSLYSGIHVVLVPNAHLLFMLLVAFEDLIYPFDVNTLTSIIYQDFKKTFDSVLGKNYSRVIY